MPAAPPPGVRIPSPPQPWAQAARDAAARLHVVPAFVPREGEPVSAPPAAPCPTSRGLHRPHTARATWIAAALVLALLLGAAVILGSAR